MKNLHSAYYHYCLFDTERFRSLLCFFMRRQVLQDDLPYVQHLAHRLMVVSNANLALVKLNDWLYVQYWITNVQRLFLLE